MKYIFFIFIVLLAGCFEVDKEIEKTEQESETQSQAPDTLKGVKTNKVDKPYFNSDYVKKEIESELPEFAKRYYKWAGVGFDTKFEMALHRTILDYLKKAIKPEQQKRDFLIKKIRAAKRSVITIHYLNALGVKE